MSGSQEVAPMVITYRQVFRRPQVAFARKFVGFKKLVANIRAKVKEVVEELAFDTERTVIDAGDSRAVHWAINVRDPWESSGEAELVAYQIPGLKPPAGYHFEVVQIMPPAPEPVAEPRNGVSHNPPAGVADRIRQSMRNPFDNDHNDTAEDEPE